LRISGSEYYPPDSLQLWIGKLIALAINAEPGEMFKELFAELGLKGKKDGNVKF
jgi:hypothetical protein